MNPPGLTSLDIRVRGLYPDKERYWPTPSAQEPGWAVDGSVEVVDKDGNPPAHPNQRFYDKNTGRIVQKGLQQVVQMYPTMTVADATGGHTSKGKERPDEGGLAHTVKHRSWPTPMVRDGHSKGPSEANRKSPGLETVARYATPQARDFRTGQTERWDDEDRSRNLNDQVGGQLNAEWVEWLQGWPIGWTSLDPMPKENFDLWLQHMHAGTWWLQDPADNEDNPIPRVVKGMKGRVPRLKALGNGQVPLCAATAFLLMIEELR